MNYVTSDNRAYTAHSVRTNPLVAGLHKHRERYTQSLAR